MFSVNHQLVSLSQVKHKIRKGRTPLSSHWISERKKGGNRWDYRFWLLYLKSVYTIIYQILRVPGDTLCHSYLHDAKQRELA